MKCAGITPNLVTYNAMISVSERVCLNLSPWAMVVFNTTTPISNMTCFRGVFVFFFSSYVASLHHAKERKSR
jgi:hypothetical protein